MNISASRVRECRDRDGEAAEERPDHTDAALCYRRRIGYNSGLPLVGDVGDPPKLGEDVRDFYSHYPNGSDVLLPENFDFVADLFDAVGSLDAAEAETKIDKATLRKAADLHSLNLPDGDGFEEPSEDVIQLPSGERWDVELLADPPESDCRLLTQLLATDKMGVGEASEFLTRALNRLVQPQDVREAAQECNLLHGGEDKYSGNLAPREPQRTQVTSSTEEPAKSPWPTDGHS